MLRRDFLNLSAVAAAWLLLPSQAKAATTTYTGPLWVFIHASGGWDPTSLCDPKGNGITAPQGGPMNNFSSNSIRTAAGSSIRYAPLTGDGYAFSTFFEKYGKDLLVVNGIDAQTNGHSTGTRYAWSGNLSLDTTSTAALFASILMPTSPLSFITFGGYDFTGGLIPATRLNNTAIIDKLAEPNLNGSTPFYSQTTLNYIKDANKARGRELAGQESLASSRNALTGYNESHERAKMIKDFQVILDTTSAVGGESSMRRESRIAMASYRAGLTVSVNIDTGGFDTHSNHDTNHTRRLGQLLRGIDEIMQEAQAQGMQDRITIVVGSEFGRTRGYNSGNGKDHWPVTSMMFMGSGIRGGRVIGATTDHHVVRKVNPTTLALDNSGISLTPAHITKALRNLAGVGSDPLVTQSFPINVPSLNLFS